MTWVETSSPHFAARHEEDDADDVVAVLELLEGTRLRLAGAFGEVPAPVAVVVHPSAAALDVAVPGLTVARRLTAPAGRRYLAGWAADGVVHTLSPRLLEQRASAVPGSREMLMLTPAALYAQLVVGAANPALPSPLPARRLARGRSWIWLVAGAAQYFSGQTAHARPALARRLREGPRPAFPPSARDAALLGGSVIDLLAAEHGEESAVKLVAAPLDRDGPRHALVGAFRGRALAHSEAAWRRHLADLAEP